MKKCDRGLNETKHQSRPLNLTNLYRVSDTLRLLQIIILRTGQFCSYSQ